MGFEINTDKASDWIIEWKDSFGAISDDPASMKTLIYLTLLERQNELLSYQNIADELKRRGVIEGEIDNFTPLRNGMAQLVNALQTHNLYEIENKKNGKEASYRLKRRGQNGFKSTGTGDGKIIKVLDDPGLTSSTEFEYVAEKLMIDRVMPFYGIYLPMPAASRWVLYSEGEAKERSKYEGEECERLLGDWLSKYCGKEISIIGLGVGEGIGEIEIIRRLLDENDGFSRIHYCAIDTNVHLLMDHIERLRHKFKDEIEANRLVCGVVCGNFLEDFSHLVQRLRDEFAASGQLLDSGQGFLPDTGTLISILGNVVGNAEKAKEWSYFEPIIKELKGYDLAFLLGVSQQPEQTKPENYAKDLEDLLLATPRYLTHELTMLKTHQPENDKDEPEFVLPEDEAKRNERWPGVAQTDYEGAGIKRIAGAQVRGKIYEFYYVTKWELSMELDGKTLSIPGGANLLLYNIIKFNKDTLIKFLESKGLYPSRQKTNPDEITSGNENRRYVIIAMTNQPPE